MTKTGEKWLKRGVFSIFEGGPPLYSFFLHMDVLNHIKILNFQQKLKPQPPRGPRYNNFRPSWIFLGGSNGASGPQKIQGNSLTPHIYIQIFLRFYHMKSGDKKNKVLNIVFFAIIERWGGRERWVSDQTYFFDVFFSILFTLFHL